MLRNIDLNRISDFLRIVEFGSITKAAASVNQPKTKFSRSLALLEQELGVQLIYRTTRHLQLTDAGQDFFREAKVHLNALEGSIKEILGQDEDMKGLVKLTAPEDLGNEVLTPIIAEFMQMYPKVQFELIYTNEVLNLTKLGVDVAYRIGQLKDSSLIHKKLGNIHFVLVASAKFLDKISPLKSPEDLMHVKTISFTGIEQGRWALQSGGAKKTLSLKSQILANNFFAVRHLTLSGMGVAFLPKFFCEPYLASGELVQVLKAWGAAGSPLQAVLPQQKNIAKRIRVFFDFSTKRLTERL